MKLILFVTILGISLTFYSCSEHSAMTKKRANTDECVQENWLTIYRKNDEVLFHSDENEIDAFAEIKALLLNGDIRLWYERKNNANWMTSPLSETVRDSIRYNDSLYYNAFFDYESAGGIPLKKKNGEDSLHIYPDGTAAYIYPFSKFDPVTLELVTEIRIKENRVYDSISNSYYLKPVMVAFDVYTWKHNILFWVEVDDLDKHLQINRAWIDHITKKKYRGFAYQRRSCDDPEYKHKIIYPPIR